MYSCAVLDRVVVKSDEVEGNGFKMVCGGSSGGGRPLKR